jgi:hypothetical protein
MRILIILLLATSVYAKKNVVYKYKKYEKFDFDNLGLEGAKGSPGDLSINQRLQRKFKNKLLERKNFNKEIKRSIDGLL